MKECATKGGEKEQPYQNAMGTGFLRGSGRVGRKNSRKHMNESRGKGWQSLLAEAKGGNAGRRGGMTSYSLYRS